MCDPEIMLPKRGEPRRNFFCATASEHYYIILRSKRLGHLSRLAGIILHPSCSKLLIQPLPLYLPAPPRPQYPPCQTSKIRLVTAIPCLSLLFWAWASAACVGYFAVDGGWGDNSKSRRGNWHFRYCTITWRHEKLWSRNRKMTYCEQKSWVYSFQNLLRTTAIIITWSTTPRRNDTIGRTKLLVNRLPARYVWKLSVCSSRSFQNAYCFIPIFVSPSCPVLYRTHRQGGI